MISRYVFLLLTLLWFSITVLAADESEKTTAEKEQTTDKSKTSNKMGVSKRAQIKTLEEFIPSEEISADKPVAFPNDI